MSGICGIVSLGGQDPGEPDIIALTAAMARRGPDRQSHWRGGRVALGHALLATTPEAVTERLPLTLDGCTITADARLDNRAELIAALGVDSDLVGDGELILRAYLFWGEDCPRHLLGDFAFAIWDEREEKLFCARDHFGVRQLAYWHVAGDRLSFATEAEYLVVGGQDDPVLNPDRIADFLDDLEEVDLTSTFFADIDRLPPAHSLSLDANGDVRIRRYWLLQGQRELHLESDAAYASAFRKVFDDAVRCRLRSASEVGSLLSGGIDSNAVVAAAVAELRRDGHGSLPTFSFLDRSSAECLESKAIRSGTSSPYLDAHFITFDEVADLSGRLIDLAELCREPFDAHQNIIRALYWKAERQGIRVILDGVFGDSVLTAGNRVAQLLRAGRFQAAVAEARAETAFWHSTTTSQRVLSAAIWAAFLPDWLRGLRRRFLAWHHARSTEFGNRVISPAFADQVNLAKRRASLRKHSAMGRSWHRDFRVQAIRNPNLTAAAERYDRIAADFAIEPRHPFLDVRLVEFCLSLPSVQLQRGGLPKMVLRHAMAGIVPDEVRMRRGKEHLGWRMTLDLIDRWPDWASEVKAAFASLTDYLDPRSDSIDAVDIGKQYEIVILSKWLFRHRKVSGS